MTDSIPIQEFIEDAGTQDWRVLSDGMCAFFRTSTFAESTDLVRAIGGLRGVEEHRPAIDIRNDGVTVRVVTYEEDYFGPGKRDLELARAISVVARDMGFTPEPAVVQSILIIPGALNIAEIMPFWEAVLGYERRRDSQDEDLVDTHDRGPAFWLEKMNEPRADGAGAIHVGIWVPIEVAEARVAAALAAGGKMVRDEFAPSWWTLADAAGNEADIGTIANRS